VSDEFPEFVRLSGGRFGWFERDLSPGERFEKMLAELEELERDVERVGRLRVNEKLALMVAYVNAPLVDLSPAERDVAREILRRRIARREGEIADELSALEDDEPDA
jgi:hypothetical protein